MTADAKQNSSIYSYHAHSPCGVHPSSFLPTPNRDSRTCTVTRFEVDFDLESERVEMRFRLHCVVHKGEFCHTNNLAPVSMYVGLFSMSKSMLSHVVLLAATMRLCACHVRFRHKSKQIKQGDGTDEPHLKKMRSTAAGTRGMGMEGTSLTLIFLIAAMIKNPSAGQCTVMYYRMCSLTIECVLDSAISAFPGVT